MHHGEDVAAVQLERPRRWLRGDHAEAEHGAVLGEPAVHHRADPRGSARYESAERGGPSRAWMLPEFPPVLAGFVLELLQDDPGARADDAVACVEADDLVHRREVEDHAASHRDRLAVVAGARAARCDGHAGSRGDARGFDDVGFGLRQHQRVASHAAQLFLEFRGVPVEVTGRQGDSSRRVVVVRCVDDFHAPVPELCDRDRNRLGGYPRACIGGERAMCRRRAPPREEARDD
jgi:hypothetical protein